MDWLHEQIGEDYNDDYIIFDLPGQIEIYTHMDIMRRFIEKLDDWHFRTIAVYTLDANFLTDGPKFIAGSMTALSTMVSLEIPQINLITKMDLISKRDKAAMEKFLEPDSEEILGAEVETEWNKKYLKLTLGIGKVLDDFSLVKYFPLDIRRENALESLCSMVDRILGIWDIRR
jgi:GPN-loop GTPase